MRHRRGSGLDLVVVVIEAILFRLGQVVLNESDRFGFDVYN